MGLFSSKTKTTSTSDIDKTSTPVAPDWLTGGLEAVWGKAGELGEMDPSTLVAGADPLQTGAGDLVGDLTGSPWNFDAAADLTRGVAGAPAPRINAQSLLEGFGNYFDPFEQRVIDTSLADFDANAGQTRARQSLDMAREGAFGGSGSGIARALTEEGLGRARGALDAGIRSEGFSKAAGLSNLDADRRQGAATTNAGLMAQGQDRTLQAAGQLAGLSTAYDANQRANAGTMADIGGTLRGIEGDQLRAPFDQTQWLASILAGLPLEAVVGEHTVGTEKSTGTSKGGGGLFGSILGAAGSLATGAGALGFKPFG